MKTKSTVIKNYLAILLVGLLPAMGMAQGKLGNLKDKAKEKVGGGKDKTSETTTNTATETGTTGKTDLASSKKVPVTAPTVIMTTENGGKTHQTNFDPSSNIVVRFAFPKTVGEAYAESQGLSDVPSTGECYIVVAKNIDDENPIIMLKMQIMTSRFSKPDDNTLDYVFQGSEKFFTDLKAEGPEFKNNYTFNSLSSMAPNSLSDEWKRKAATFKSGKSEWEMMLIFIPYNSDDASKVKMMCSAKFTYDINSDSKKILTESMNDYDKQRFEKTPDDGYPTAVHKSNTGKIVFTNSFMGKTFDDASKVKNSYDNLAGGIYSRLYLKESMRNFYADYGLGKDVSGATYSLFFYVDGSSEYSCYQDSKISKEEAMTMTSWAIPLAPVNKEDFDYDNGTVNRFAYVISELTPGKHKIKVVAKSQYGATREESAIIGEGEFEINITAADRDAFVKKYGLQMPEKGLLATDAKLLADVKIVAGKEAIDVRCPNVWEERKDAWGVVTHRVTLVAYSYKDEKGRGKQDTFMIKQPKTGSGWGATNATAEEKTWYSLDSYLPLQNSK